MPTIKEIAELAGVSRGTVDRVLNNRGGVNEKTAEKIREIAERLDYKPNKAGLLLAAQKKNIKIGVVIFSDENPFFAEVLDGIRSCEAELSAYNCSLIIRQVIFEERAQFDCMESLLAEGINGLVISPYNSLFIAAEIDRFVDMGIAVVTVNTDIASKRMAYVGCDFRLSGQTAAGLMGRMTFGEIHAGVVLGSEHILCHSERVAGFTEVIEASYPRIHVAEVIENHDNDVESYARVKNLLESHPEINAMYFCAGGVGGGCQAIQAAGRMEPMKIFTHDAVPATKKLIQDGVIAATICQQPFRQGSWPVDLLSRFLLEGKEPEREFNYVELDIKIRENI